MVKIKCLKCRCGTKSNSETDLCAICGERIEPIEIESKGMVLSFTRLHVPVKGFPQPLGIAIVELQDDFRIMCNTRSDRVYSIGEEVSIEFTNEHWYISE